MRLSFFFIALQYEVIVDRLIEAASYVCILPNLSLFLYVTRAELINGRRCMHCQATIESYLENSLKRI